MNDTFSIFSSRKFWVGTVSVAAVFASVLLVALKIIPESSLIPTISAITATSLGFMGTTAWVDAASQKAAAPPPATATTNVTNVSNAQPTPPT